MRTDAMRFLNRLLNLVSPRFFKRGKDEIKSDGFIITCLIFWGAVFFSQAQAQTPVPATAAQIPTTVAQAAVPVKATPSPDLNMSPQEEIQVLDAIDASPNSSSASSSVTASPSAAPATLISAGPPSVPTGLKILALKEGVYLSWDAAPIAAAVVSYNVYRSTVPGSGYRKVNLKPLAAPYFLDGVENSVSRPKNGEDYFYVVAAVDPQGRVSEYSDEASISPEGMELPLSDEEKAEAEKAKASPTPEVEQNLNVPEKKILNLSLPADTQLSIQGYKKIEAIFSFKNYTGRQNGGTLGLPNSDNNTTVNQELVVNLQGKVGKNVDVNVDYSDVNRNNGLTGAVDNSKQNISIVYHGDADSPIQEVAFGDLQLYLPNTEFAGFSKQLFGLQGKFKLDRLRLTSFFAQTKGISETKVFTGNAVQVKRDINDIDYLRYKYFYITREPYLYVNSGVTQVSVTVVNPQLLPQNNSERIWVDSVNLLQAPQGDTNYKQPAFGGIFERWLPGRDYTMDYSTGIITFIRNLPSNARIAVAFRKIDQTYVGFDSTNTEIDLSNPSQVDPFGRVSDSAHWLKDNTDQAAVPPNYLLNYFDLGRDKIIPPQQDPNFVFEVIDQGTNSILQTGTNGPWAYFINQDLNYLNVTDASLNQPASFLFPERPFGGSFADGGKGANEPYSQSPSNPPVSSKRIHLEYKTRLDFFRLDRFNIIRGSEAVYLDGRRLRRDADYFFDYTSGFLDFQDKSTLTPQSQVVVTYEYAPFGSFGQSNILGARAEYDITDHLFLGSTFLYDTAQTPQEVPQVGSTPNSLALLDADVKYDIGSDEIQSITGIIPGLENWKPPLSIKLSGEVAQSYFNPDTYSAEGENGVAMVDNMEGIDNITGPSMSPLSWLVSAAPLPPQAFQNLVPVQPAAGPYSGNNRVRFYNDSSVVSVNGNITSSSILKDFQQIGTSSGSGGLDFSGLPGYGGHIYAASKNSSDLTTVLQFPYSHLTNQRWAGLRTVLSPTGVDLSSTRYLQCWVYNDDTPKWIMIDFGMFNEDSNGNSAYDFDASVTLNRPASITYGIPTFYDPNTPWYVNPITGITSTPGAIVQQDAVANPQPNWGFIGYAGESSTQEGVSIQSVGSSTQYVTEDIDSNNTLDSPPNDSYFEYGIQLPPNQNAKWQLIKIPVNFTAADASGTTPEGLNYFFHSQGTPDPQAVRAVRLWMTGADSSERNGDIWMENINFTHNQWQLQVDPNAPQGVTINSAKFDVNSISHDIDPRYSGSLRFLTITTGQDQTAVQTKEKSLKVTYDLSDGDLIPPIPGGAPGVGGTPAYYATRLFSQGLDFTDYQELRMDLQAITFQPGEVLFVRLGNDQQDYYQYNVKLTSQYYNTWNTVTIPLDGSGGNRLKVGTPYINRTSQISIGVFSTNGQAPPFSVNYGSITSVQTIRLKGPAWPAGPMRRSS